MSLPKISDTFEIPFTYCCCWNYLSLWSNSRDLWWTPFLWWLGLCYSQTGVYWN